MKYGPIICDPTSEEAKALIGKKVICGSLYVQLDSRPESYNPSTLTDIAEEDFDPFVNDTNSFFPFIREVIEEEPKYRPYESTEEMVADYKERFADILMTGSVEMPFLWVKHKVSERSFLVIGFGGVGVDIFCASLEWDELFDHYTYLDGSPVGKEET